MADTYTPNQTTGNYTGGTGGNQTASPLGYNANGTPILPGGNPQTMGSATPNNPTNYGVVAAPAVVTAKPAVTDATNIQNTMNDKAVGASGIATSKQGLTTTYDAQGNMLITGQTNPQTGQQYQQFIPKTSPSYIPNPADVKAQSDAATSAAETASTNALTATATGTTATTPYTNPSPVQPPPGVNPTTAQGQIDWYNQDPQAFEQWGQAQGMNASALNNVAYQSSVQTLNGISQDYNSKLIQLANGTYPLTPDQSATLSALQTRWESVINAQQEANKTYQNAFGMAQARRGGEYDPMGSTGEATRAMQVGINAISNEQAQETQALANMRQAFEDSNFKRVTTAYNAMVQNDKNITDTMKGMYDAAVSAQEYADKQAEQTKNDYYNEVTQPIQNISLEAAKNGASPDIIAKINSADTVQDAIAAAGDNLQTGTGTLGDYLQYKRDTQNKGLIPVDYQTYQDEQNKKDLQQKASLAYTTQAAKDQADNANTLSDKVQQKLEQQYRQVLSKEFSSRTGALGIENQKVNQANHLNSLVQQYYDPKTGNYNIPTSQYSELVMGLANLISPNGVVSDSARDAINQKTAKGDLAGALSYITGQPQTGNTQGMIKNLVDSVDRQAQTAEQNREAALQNMRDQAPTDLEQSRVDALNKSTQMVRYTGQDRIDKGVVDSYIKSHPDQAQNISQMFAIPGATNTTILQWLKDNNKL